MSDAEVTFASLDETFIEMFIQAAKTAVRRASLIAVRVREHLHDVDKAANKIDIENIDFKFIIYFCLLLNC